MFFFLHDISLVSFFLFINAVLNSHVHILSI